MNESFPAVPRFSHEAMTTIFEIFIPGPDAAYAGQAAREAFREIDRLEGLFNRFDPGSEISRINRLPDGGEMPVGMETFECLSLAEAVRLETAGAFDVNAHASAPSESAAAGAFLSAARAFELAGEAGGFSLRRAASGGGLCPPRLDLDLGGVGKGYALDRAMRILRDWGVTDALLHGGTSSALAAGSPSPDSGAPGWPVGVGAGWAKTPTRLVLSGRSLSGSGTEIKGGHILDPRTGQPARGNLAAWASAPTAALADALSTAFFVMTPDAVETYIRRHPDVWACLVVSYGDVRVYNPHIFSPAG